MLAVKGDEVVARDGLHGGGREIRAVGMLAVKDLAGELGREFGGLLLFLLQGGKRLPLNLGKLLGGEGGVENGVGEQVEDFAGVFGQPAGGDADGIRSGVRFEGHADGVGLQGEGGGVALGGAAVDEFGDKLGGAVFRTVEDRAAADDEPEGDGGFAVVLNDENLEAVGQRLGFVVGKGSGRRGIGRGLFRAVDGGGGGENDE